MTSPMENMSSPSSSNPDLYTSLDHQPTTMMLDPSFVFPPPSGVGEGKQEGLNPSFAFPTQPSAPDLKEPATSEAKVAEASSNARHRPDHISISKLPPFSFPAPVTPPATQSGEQSPTRSAPMSRGHKRGGSEFIGGDSSVSGPGLMSASPTKAEGALPSPSVQGRRRGHAHRRSGAISHHDLSNILKPADPNRMLTGSAPSTPSHHSEPFPNNHSLGHAASQPVLPTTVDSPSRPVDSGGEVMSAAVQPRPRVVGFSDKLEYIPRPLSTISLETSSSISTIRASHSLTGSITSIRSGGPSSPPSAKKLDPLREGFIGNTPDPFNGDFSPSNRRPSTPIRDRPPTRGGSSGDLLGHDVSDEDEESKLENETSVRFAPTDFAQLNAPPTGPSFPTTGSPSGFRRVDGPRPRSSPETKAAKEKKGKPWTGLLSRRMKDHESMEDDDGAVQGLNASNRFAPMSLLNLDAVDFDADNTTVIRNENYVPPQSAPAMKTETFTREDSDDGILDLDLTWAQQEAEAQAKAAMAAKRRLHSSGTAGGFAGPGMHHHRRAESAPALTPFNHPFAGHRVGGSPQMADVFEEDENEEHGSPGSGLKKLSMTGKAIATGDDTVTNFSKVAVSSAETEGRTGSITPTNGEGRLVEPPIESAATTTLSSFADNYTNASPIVADFAEASSRRTISIPETSTTEPSPDPTQTSFDAPRLGTAHSSMTDRSIWSARGPYPSTEDVPSLTSTASTRTGGYMPPYSSGVGTAAGGSAISRGSDERSQSVSEAPPSRPMTSSSKRTSLASLNRLLGGSFGERSKLSIESKATEDEGATSTDGPKKKKHRMSRLVRLFKSKESLRSEK